MNKVFWNNVLEELPLEGRLVWGYFIFDPNSWFKNEVIMVCQLINDNWWRDGSLLNAEQNRALAYWANYTDINEPIQEDE